MKGIDAPIYVTKPFLPSLSEFSKGLEEIWNTHWLTNNGPILQRFTRQLSNYFETDNVCLFNNGTLALQIGLRKIRYTSGTSLELVNEKPGVCYHIKYGESEDIIHWVRPGISCIPPQHSLEVMARHQF